MRTVTIFVGGKTFNISDYLTDGQSNGTVALDNTITIEGEEARATVRYRSTSASTSTSLQTVVLQGTNTVTIPRNDVVNVVIEQRFGNDWRDAGGHITIN